MTVLTIVAAVPIDIVLGLWYLRTPYYLPIRDIWFGQRHVPLYATLPLGFLACLGFFCGIVLTAGIFAPPLDRKDYDDQDDDEEEA